MTVLNLIKTLVKLIKVQNRMMYHFGHIYKAIIYPATYKGYQKAAK